MGRAWPERAGRLKAGVVMGEPRARVAEGFRDPAAHDCAAATRRGHTLAERAARYWGWGDDWRGAGAGWHDGRTGGGLGAEGHEGMRATGVT